MDGTNADSPERGVPSTFFSRRRAALRGFLSLLSLREVVMRRIRTTIHALIAASVVAGGMTALAPSALAITIPVACGEQDLVDAVKLANSTSAADTLTLASGCTYRMTSAHGESVNGRAALPIITTPIEMIGPATITRDSLVAFRIAEVSRTGSLTLTTGVALTNGSAVGQDGAVGHGGGILNFGSVTLTGSSLSGNKASGDGGGLANADTPTGTGPAATFTNSPVSANTAEVTGGGIYNGVRGSLTTTGAVGSPLIIDQNAAEIAGGGIAANSSTATTLTDTAVTENTTDGTAGGVYRHGGTMTVTTSPITANTPNNCVGSAPAVPGCTG